jgi:pyruvate dehydrogenase E1 component alpha subunit
MACDPVATFARALEAGGVLSLAARAEIDARLDRDIDEAVAFAKGSPYPDASELAEHVYG